MEFEKVNRSGLISIIHYWRNKARRAEDEYVKYQAITDDLIRQFEKRISDIEDSNGDSRLYTQVRDNEQLGVLDSAVDAGIRAETDGGEV